MITEQQRELRKGYVGASDVAALFGASPYASAYDLWLEKCGSIESAADNAFTERGTHLEPGVLAWAMEQGDLAGLKFEQGVMKVCKDVPELAANFDAIETNGLVVLEAKTNAIPGAYRDDEMPERVLIQVTAQMMVAGPQCQRAYVAVLQPHLNMELFTVARDETLCQAIAESVRNFWQYVKRKIEPHGLPGIETLKLRKRVAGEVKQLPVSAVQLWQDAREKLKLAEEHEELCRRAVLHEMRDAEVGECELGRVTYHVQNRTKINLDKIRAEHPGFLDQYTTPNPTRALHWSPQKAK